MAMLALSDRHGEVDVTPQKIADCLGCEAAFVLKGIEQLSSPDEYSRTPKEGGRRIIPLESDEGTPRLFGWKIVNYEKYRSIRNEEERRAYKRDWDRDNRGKKSVPTKPDRARPKTTYTEADTDTERERKPSKFVPQDWNPRESTKAKVMAMDGTENLVYERELEQFRNCEFKIPKKDFDRAFVNWVINSIKFSEGKK